MSSNRWAWATAAYAALMLAVSVIPISVEGPDVPQLDKLLHVGEFLVFAWLLIRAKTRPVPAWLLAAAYGAMIEVVQGFLPWRSASWWDLGANLVGATAGVWFSPRHP